jgi:deoxyribonuclease-4
MPDPQPTLDTQFDAEDEYRPEPEPETLPPTWMDGSLRIGIHASIARSYLNALESARKLGCNAVQIFSWSPRMWQGGPARIPEVDAAAFRARRAELGIGPLVIHANYLINLAARQPMLRTRSIQAFHDELVRSIALGADFLVVHPGSRGEATPEQSVVTVIESVKQGSKRLSLGNLRILIENTAGMGVAVGARLEELAEILAGLKDVPAAACLDTAHLFAAGYDIKSETGLTSTVDLIDSTIGLDRVPVFHANDSKIKLGGRVDRHENIGQGEIGADAFRRILTHPRLGAAFEEGLTGRTFVLETPIDRPGDDHRNVAKLWELAGLSDQAPPAEKGFSMLTAAIKKIQMKTAATAKRAERSKKTPEASAPQSSEPKKKPQLAAKKSKVASKSKKSRKTKRG